MKKRRNKKYLKKSVLLTVCVTQGNEKETDLLNCKKNM